MNGDNHQGRRYVVLLNDIGTDTWQRVGVEVATSAGQACRRAAQRIDETELETGVVLRAVPERTWQASETRLRLERQTRLVSQDDGGP